MMLIYAHSPIPHLRATDHTVQITGQVSSSTRLTIEDLASFPQHTVLCALQCAGNRRYMHKKKFDKDIQGINWFDGAVMNCTWTGPRLKDVLEKAGVTVSKEQWKKSHVAFACLGQKCQEDEWYGGSIFLDRAMREDADVILALKVSPYYPATFPYNNPSDMQQMNNETLTPAHGYPVRVVVPGIAGARSVKWLDRITVQSEESSNHYQKRDYKILPPDTETMEQAKRHWDSVPALQDMPINSVVALPAEGSKVTADKTGEIETRGYALPQGEDGPIVRVEVSGDGGETWKDAELIRGDEEAKKLGVTTKWAWYLWKAKVPVAKGKGRRLLSRATDKAGNKQEASPNWNLRGVCYNGYGESKDIEVL